ncbi:MAG TPA: hypothetical protein VGM37_19395 [Armatimonadota bacterium]|jgi:tetratricopeptide (TPR) repeat protein
MIKSVLLGLCVISLGVTASAAKPERAPHLKPQSVKAADDRIDRAVNQLLVQSDVFWHAGDYESVRWCYSVITDLDPTYVEGWQNYGWLLWSGLDRDDAAMRVFMRGLKYNPNTYELYFEAGSLEYHRRRFLSAAEWLSKATARKAPFTVWHMRAHCLEYARQDQKAIALWKEIVRRFPKDDPAKLNLKRMLEGRFNRTPLLGVEEPKGNPSPRQRDPLEVTSPQQPGSI